MIDDLFQVPRNDSKGYIKSFRLQNLEPYTDYVVQVRCMSENGHGYWSDWSQNVTRRTPEASTSPSVKSAAATQLHKGPAADGPDESTPGMALLIRK